MRIPGSAGTPRFVSVLRVLFWPKIENAVDADGASRQGFWVIVGVASFCTGCAIYKKSDTILLFLPYFVMAATGVRQKSLFAAVSVFGLLSIAVFAFASPWHFEWAYFILCMLMVTGVRSAWWSEKHPEEMKQFVPVLPTEPTIVQRFVDIWSARIWWIIEPLAVVWCFFLYYFILLLICTVYMSPDVF